MLARTTCASLIGVDAVPVTVEVDVSPGLPAFQIVGLPDQAVSEARERVRAAIRNSGWPFPAARITVNLAPADLRKEGPLFDLPIALGVLAAQGLIPQDRLNGLMVAGELALDGSLRAVAGAVNLALRACELGWETLLPAASAPEAALVHPGDTWGAATLSGAARHLTGDEPLPTPPVPQLPEPEETPLDLLDVRGQQAGKRALEIALAGGHILLMIGSPGSGKTMLARRAPGLLPPLTRQESLDVLRVHSAAGLMNGHRGLPSAPPYRAPHHTVSDVGLIGGGSVPKPGEVSLAHRGVLFLKSYPDIVHVTHR